MHLRDAHWERIKDLLPGYAGQPEATARDNRLFVDAVFYRYRTGIFWQDLPARFGDFRAVHTRHSRWSKSGVWQRVFEALPQEADNEYAMIDDKCSLPMRLTSPVGSSTKRQLLVPPVVAPG